LSEKVKVLFPVAPVCLFLKWELCFIICKTTLSWLMQHYCW